VGLPRQRIRRRRRRSRHHPGARYAISGKRIPSRLPWAEGILGLHVDPFDKHVSADPTAVPDRVTNPAVERVHEQKLPPGRVSTDPAVRLRNGHGHMQEDSGR